ncbi:Lipoic acid synthetase [Purpureocillium lavendulum]|uniref:Lipoic acid synthetase n=1 Tax=Purpureocillium lavendulum TaxID=1247861 RepID=A0AB34G7E9_9HYPO|nr:Lipoic acid synthetase [Purpureocillium lavendulum]
MAARGPADAAAAGVGGHGLRFLNDEWNDSISNGDPFTLRWNQSVAKAGSQLGLFKVTYPEDGVIVYELVTNLTESMDTAQCVWTPDHLEGGLYALWLSNGQHAHANWTISPPWVPKEEPKTNSVPSNNGKLKTGGNHLHWAAPIVIPVVSLLVLYGICLTAYLLHRRRKKAKRDKEDATPHQDVNRNNSVDSAVTVQTFTVDAEEFKEKYGRLRAASNGGEIWIFADASDHNDVTVGGIPEKDIADVERGGSDEGDVHEIDHRTIGIGL